jgi:hypothetical protein
MISGARLTSRFAVRIMSKEKVHRQGKYSATEYTSVTLMDICLEDLKKTKY